MSLSPRSNDPNKKEADKEKALHPHKWASTTLITQSIELAKAKQKTITKKIKKK